MSSHGRFGDFKGKGKAREYTPERSDNVSRKGRAREDTPDSSDYVKRKGRVWPSTPLPYGESADDAKGKGRAHELTSKETNSASVGRGHRPFHDVAYEDIDFEKARTRNLKKNPGYSQHWVLDDDPVFGHAGMLMRTGVSSRPSRLARDEKNKKLVTQDNADAARIRSSANVATTDFAYQDHEVLRNGYATLDNKRAQLRSISMTQAEAEEAYEKHLQEQQEKQAKENKKQHKRRFFR